MVELAYAGIHGEKRHSTLEMEDKDMHWPSLPNGAFTLALVVA